LEHLRTGASTVSAVTEDGATTDLGAVDVGSADAGVIDAADGKRFIAAAKTRQWDREPKVRTLS